MISMTSREDETVHFPHALNCTGSVESWLMRFVECMRYTLRTMLREAVSVYEDRPREDWLRYYPAQIALVGYVLLYVCYLDS